ncbi:MAG: hypothetical protein H6Q90_1892 [Deltaproteobacteria bacterium]|nr:hypothetical protein [Deltaproteobacteria bacterium]
MTDLLHTRGVSRFALMWSLAVLPLACGPGKPAEQPRPAAIATHDDPTCPVVVAGTSVSVEDTDQGAAFVFITTGDVAAVRSRASALAAMHEAHPQMGSQMGSMISVASTATASEIPGGARVTFTTTSASDAAKLQAELRMHAHHLASGSCVM